MGRTTPVLPGSVRHVLKELGKDLNAARRRRRVSMEILANRAMISRVTVGNVLRGDPTTSMGAYASVLFALGMADRLSTLAAAVSDPIGVALEEERLPQRVRAPRSRPVPGSDQDA